MAKCKMKWVSKTLIFSLSVFATCLSVIFFTGKYKFPSDEYIYHLYIKTNKVLFQTDKKFLSVALDTSFMKCYFYRLNESAWRKLEELSSLLSPGYLRLGGTAADEVIFIENLRDSNLTIAGKNCLADMLTNESLLITGEAWIKVNNFANKSRLNVIFDINALLRTETGWDSSNAQALLNFSEKNGFPLDFQLGNEPNSFIHTFNVSLPGIQLAKDFNQLKNILNSYKMYRNSKLIGPDVTKPRHIETSSNEYLRDFLSNTNSISAVSWHQYYLNGKTAQLEDFINPDTFDLLSLEIRTVSKIVREFSNDLPIWISETSSAYGGGAPNLSDRFVASFLWLDKLGIAAKLGMSVVIRQSLLKENYALLDSELSPTPDFWISFFYKNLVGSQVLDVINDKSRITEHKYLRFYSHCSASNEIEKKQIVVFGMNFSNKTEKVVVSGFGMDYPIHSFTFTSGNEDLRSRSIYMNGKKLVYNKTSVYDLLKNPQEEKFPLPLPGYSIVFWIFHGSKKNACHSN